MTTQQAAEERAAAIIRECRAMTHPAAQLSETEDPEFLDTDQLSEYLNLSKKTIEKWRDEQRIPGAVRCGRVWRFRKVEIEKQLLTGEFPRKKAA